MKKCLYRSANGKMMVREEIYKGNPARVLLVNGVAESASFTEEPYRCYPPFEYLRHFDRFLTMRENTKEVLLLGGAGFSFPKYMLSRHPEMYMDVVEIDPMMVKLAREYFYLDEALDRYGRDRVRIIYGDANHYVKNTDKSYQVIFHDAYLEDHIDQGLLSDEGIRTVKKHMPKDGIYVVNFITAISGMQSLPGIMARAMFREHFENVLLFSCEGTKKKNARQNCILVGTNGELTIKGMPQLSNEIREYCSEPEPHINCAAAGNNVN